MIPAAGSLTVSLTTGRFEHLTERPIDQQVYAMLGLQLGPTKTRSLGLPSAQLVLDRAGHQHCYGTDHEPEDDED
jgi:hypothetical protein